MPGAGTHGLVHGSPLVFVAGPREQPDVEIRVNFGMFAGRQATQAELDDLGRELLAVVRRVSIVSLDRHELGEGGEAAVHQVKVEATTTDALRPGEALEEQLVGLVDAWARNTIEQRHVETAEVDALPRPAR